MNLEEVSDMREPSERSKNRQERRSPGSAATLVFYATRSGGTTFDTGEGGGNPFASALIEAASHETLPLRDLAASLGILTTAKSQGHQVVEWCGDTHLPDWRFLEDHSLIREKRSALVLTVSDYSGSGLDIPLSGAAHDERRIAAMLAQYGFSVEQGIGPRRNELIRALVSFRRRSLGSDIGIIYLTGHGVECDGRVYLLPGDYPRLEGFGRAQLRKRAVSVTQMINAASARSQNIVFFAGCRTLVSNTGAIQPNTTHADNS
jgi:hypothetical protein